MADPLYLNLWFPSFSGPEMMLRLLCVLRQFPFSAARPGIGYVAVHPISWEEPTIFEQRFNPGATPEEAIAVVADLLHDDYAYAFEAWWDLWSYLEGPAAADEEDERWRIRPSKVEFVVHGPGFDEGAHEDEGHIQVDLGLDTQFLHEEVDLSPDAELKMKGNVQRLVNFSAAVEKHCGLQARVLWSESEESLAQKLIARLQKVQ
ncbi:MAG TPA: hypothetical protein VE825_02690 [Terriglobales bacterium]|jgi:hypothetical protein|nr:hypothetical protein [Terriglobales bacterium]